MSIYQNAIDSIQIGVEDFKLSNPKRNISAIRNIIAGILLLYKEKLRSLSPLGQPDLLIKQSIKPVLNDGHLTFIGTGNTVNIDTIKTRFTDLEVHVDWKRFDKVVKLRNDLEHHFTTESPDAIREIVSSSFILIRDFLSIELHEDPMEILGQETWEVLLAANEVFEAEKKVCQESLEQVDWKYTIIKDNLDNLRCEDCGSSLIYCDNPHRDFPDISLQCRNCSHSFEFSNIAEAYINEALQYEIYTSFKDGGEHPLETCPDCGQDTYILAEDRCVICGYELKYTECTVCHIPLGVHEQMNDGLCDYHEYIKNKEFHK